MPKSKKRKGHAKRVKANHNARVAKQNKAMKDFKAKLEDIKKQQKVQDEVTVQLANESMANELVVDNDPLTLPELGYDATTEILKVNE